MLYGITLYLSASCLSVQTITFTTSSADSLSKLQKNMTESWVISTAPLTNRAKYYVECINI